LKTKIEYTKGLEHGFHAVESYPDPAVWRVNGLAMTDPGDGATRGDASTKARIRRAAVFGDGGEWNGRPAYMSSHRPRVEPTDFNTALSGPENI
jgi:hypothetical protein